LRRKDGSGGSVGGGEGTWGGGGRRERAGRRGRGEVVARCDAYRVRAVRVRVARGLPGADDAERVAVGLEAGPRGGERYFGDVGAERGGGRGEGEEEREEDERGERRRRRAEGEGGAHGAVWVGREELFLPCGSCAFSAVPQGLPATLHVRWCSVSTISWRMGWLVDDLGSEGNGPPTSDPHCSAGSGRACGTTTAPHHGHIFQLPGTRDTTCRQTLLRLINRFTEDRDRFVTVGGSRRWYLSDFRPRGISSSLRHFCNHWCAWMSL
jgi:hypothetical protein